jgi:hypothetical protein
LASSEVVGYELCSQSFGVGGVVDPSVGGVGAQRVVDVPHPEPPEGVTFPVVLLAPVVAQSQCSGALGEPGEQAARLDLRELAGVTNEYECGAAAGGVGEQPGKSAGVDDAGFVQDDNSGMVQPVGLPGGRVGLVGFGEQPGQ